MNSFSKGFIGEFRYFIVRDFMYFLGGGSVILTIIYVFEIPVRNGYPTAIWLLVAGGAYGVGYAIKDIMSFIPFLSNAPNVNPSWFDRCLYRCFTREEWSPISTPGEKRDIIRKWKEISRQFEKEAEERIYMEYQRIVGHYHVGSVLGVNWLVCVSFLAIHIYNNKDPILNWKILLFPFLLSMGLMILSRIKNMQYVRYIIDHGNNNDPAAISLPGGKP